MCVLLYCSVHPGLTYIEASDVGWGSSGGNDITALGNEAEKSPV